MDYYTWINYYIGKDVELGKGVKISRGAYIENGVKISDNMSIGHHAVIHKGVEIKESCIIEPFCGIGHLMIGVRPKIVLAALILAILQELDVFLIIMCKNWSEVKTYKFKLIY